ncbi:hypothetical protein BDP27DRAFT_1275610 [Rhodocollybia butyracea]|uniref:Uncharacterized protein n=1 Tax=Rhodocollybia butyracea TaxID=206335 RepID=A0A9P5P4I2_9AGAR|nr:hypothetical protein BDP27DRAFT_1275610 [Rhodocollybia butyracea]
METLPQRVHSNVLRKANSNGSRFHVVIVGINKYDDPRTPALKGCVHDALLFRGYLMHDLSVPSDRITLLLSPTCAKDVDGSVPYKPPLATIS